MTILVCMCEDMGEIDFLALAVFMMGEKRGEREREMVEKRVMNEKQF